MFFRRMALRLVTGLLVGLPGAFGQTGLITTIAGKTPPGGIPLRGYSGDGGPGTEALLALANLRNTCTPDQFEQLVQLTVDAAGNVYFPDSDNQRIRMIDPNGVIRTVAGTGEKPVTDSLCNPTAPIADGGGPLLAKFFNPAAVTLGPAGELTIVDQQNNRIRQVDREGIITTVPVASLNAPLGLVVDREGKLAFLRNLDVLSVPGPYPDPKGTYLLEAMATGTPVVQPRRGAYHRAP